MLSLFQQKRGNNLKLTIMKAIILNHLQNLNETSFKILRNYNSINPAKSTWSVCFFNGGSFDYTYDNQLIWNGLIR